MKFTLVVQPDGRALLTTADDLSVDQMDSIRTAWRQWVESEASVAIMPSTKVVTVTEIILDVVEHKEIVS